MASYCETMECPWFCTTVTVPTGTSDVMAASLMSLLLKVWKATVNAMTAILGMRGMHRGRGSIPNTASASPPKERVYAGDVRAVTDSNTAHYMHTMYLYGASCMLY